MTFSGEKLVFGWYRGPSIDVGPALTTKIMRNNGHQVHSSTYRALTPEKLVNPDEIKAHDEFNMAVGEKLGLAVSAENIESDREIVTLTLDWYEDDEDHHTHMPEVDYIKPEAMDN